MKIMILNFSGNVGKTTIAAHLLKARMPDAAIFSIESINTGADSEGLNDVEIMKGKNFGDLVNELMLLDDAIIDVGASNVETLLEMMKQYSGSHEEIDLFVVPVVRENKVQTDTINTIMALTMIGIDKQRIITVFNKVENGDDPRDEFASIFGFAIQQDSFVVSEDATIYENEVYERLKDAGKSLGDITNDDTDYRALAREATDMNEKRQYVQMHGLKMLAKTANKNLDAVFEVLTHGR